MTQPRRVGGAEHHSPDKCLGFVDEARATVLLAGGHRYVGKSGSPAGGPGKPRVVALPLSSRRRKRIFFSIAAPICMFMAVGWMYFGFGALRGGEATAHVVGVEHSKSTLYEVTFTTDDGQACTAKLASDETPELPVGAEVTIRYDEPCLNVWYPGDVSWVLIPLVVTVVAAGMSTAAYLAWFRTDESGRTSFPLWLRYFSAQWWNDVPPRP